jgi:hypothetical protein
MKNSALKLIEQGFSLVLLKPNSKLPVSAETTFKHATKSIETIEEWFKRWPDANIGIQPGKSGLIVLDVDVKSGGLDSLSHIQSEYGALTTLCARTASGGFHYYFKRPGFEVVNKIGLMPGIDIICDANHVVAPPSVIDGRSYSWVDSDTPILECPDWLTKLVEPPLTIKPAQPLQPSLQLKGRLSRLTEDFLENGAVPGTWNQRLFKAAIDAHEQGFSSEEFISRAEKITGVLDSKDMSTIDSAFNSQPKYAPRINPNEALRETIFQSHLITNVADTKKKIFVNISTGEVHDIEHKIIHLVLNKEEKADYLKARTINAHFEYNPRQNSLISFNSLGHHVLNTYQPPKWKSANFYSNKPIPKTSIIPPIYDQFFTHLCDGHEDSKNYLLDWIANSIKSRNFTILTAIGEEGIGKGILGHMLSSLHGESNYALCTDTVFKEKFNGKLQNKTLIYVDEIALEDTSSHDRIKAVVNEELEIERKGEDAITARNYASFYISSNRLDALKIGPEDRRYSIIQLTGTKIRDTDLRNKIQPEILNPDNLNKLAEYLFYRPINNDMLKPFRSARFDEILVAGMNTWEEFFIDEYLPSHNPGVTLDLMNVQADIKMAVGLKMAPSRRKLEALRKRFPSKFLIIQGSKGKRSIKVI